MSSGEPPGEMRQQAESAFVAALWSRINEHLEREQRRISAEIHGYPTPITACDVQFNHLLEERASIAQELARLRDVSESSYRGGGSMELLAQFARSSRHLDESVRQSILSSLHERLSERQP
jgi:chorismate mutase